MNNAIELIGSYAFRGFSIFYWVLFNYMAMLETDSIRRLENKGKAKGYLLIFYGKIKLPREASVMIGRLVIMVFIAQALGRFAGALIFQK